MWNLLISTLSWEINWGRKFCDLYFSVSGFSLNFAEENLAVYLNHIHIYVFLYIRRCVKFCVTAYGQIVSYVKFCSHLLIFVHKGLRRVVAPKLQDIKTLFPKWRLLTSIIFLQLSLLFWEGEEGAKVEKMKRKGSGGENEWKPNWAWCFLNYLFVSKGAWTCIFLWVSK